MSEGGEKKKPEKKPSGFKKSIQAVRARIDTARENYKAGETRRRVRQVEQNEERLHDLKAREEVINSRLRVQRTERRLAKKNHELSPMSRGGPMGAFSGLLGGMNEIGIAASKMGSGMEGVDDMARRANNMNAWGEYKPPKKKKSGKGGRDITIHIKR